MRALFTVAAAAVLMTPLSLAAQQAAQQEELEPERHENVTWYTVEQIDFKPGKREAALEIIRNYYAPAGVESGTPGPVMHLEHMTGEWDLTVIWHMERGPAQMEWKRSPEAVAWQKKFAEMVGGPERAREIGEEFASYIARSNGTLTMQNDDLMTALNQ